MYISFFNLVVINTLLLLQKICHIHQVKHECQHKCIMVVWLNQFWWTRGVSFFWLFFWQIFPFWTLHKNFILNISVTYICFDCCLFVFLQVDHPRGLLKTYTSNVGWRVVWNMSTTRLLQQLTQHILNFSFFFYYQELFLIDKWNLPT